MRRWRWRTKNLTQRRKEAKVKRLREVKVKLRRDTVIDGSVEQAGKVVEVDRQEALRLTRHDLIDPLEDYWQDRIEQVYPKRQGAIGEIKDVMVFVPAYRLEAETVQAVVSLRWDGPFDYAQGRALTIVIQWDNPYFHEEERKKRHVDIENVLHQYERGRETFLAGKYDAMLVIESDIIPPADALEKLAKVKADVVYGVYRFRRSNVINIFERYPDKNGIPPRNVGESLSAKPYLLRRAVQQGIYPCSGAGLGCALIRRKVLETIEFRKEVDLAAHCDTYFNRDVLKHGFSQAAEMTVICGHKDDDGIVFWPEFPKDKKTG